MKIILERDIKTPYFTLGKMYIDGQLAAYTCEDAVREKPGLPVEHWKRPGESAIPRGTYRVIITFSSRFQKHLPLLLDVPGFSGIRIHAGNTEKDTEGCILVGTGRAKESVTNSRLAMSLLMPRIEEGLKNGAVTIEIR
jgi:Family of unknown function (DUF5675)